MAYLELPMSITPDDLRMLRFAQQRRGGYDTAAVDRALDRVANRLDDVLREREELQDRVQILEAEVERYQADVERYKALEGQLTEALLTAERAAERARTEHRAGPADGVSANQDSTMVELLGEARAIRSLLQATLAQNGALPVRPPQH